MSYPARAGMVYARLLQAGIGKHNPNPKRLPQGKFVNTKQLRW
jgi:hypothetical protein